MVHGNSVVGSTTRYVCYIRLSYEGSLRGVHAVAHRVRAWSPINLRPTGHAVGVWIQLPQAGEGHSSTLNNALCVAETLSKSMPRAPSTHVNHSMKVESSSSLATVLASQLRPATPTRRTRAGRSCRARAADFGHLRSHEEAFSGWRHTGWECVGRGMARRSWPHEHTYATSPR